MVAAFVVELLMLTWLRGCLGNLASPVVFFAGSLGVGLTGLALALAASDRPPRSAARNASGAFVLLALLVVWPTRPGRSTGRGEWASAHPPPSAR